MAHRLPLPYPVARDGREREDWRPLQPEKSATGCQALPVFLATQQATAFSGQVDAAKALARIIHKNVGWVEQTAVLVGLRSLAAGLIR
ncbi:MAG: hypothetical protein ABSG68_02335, partial [Thermoguttaceae bacterium]